MSVVTWHLPSSEIIARLGFSDFRADPGNPLRYLIEDVVSGVLTATIRFSTGAGGRIVSVAMKADAGVDRLAAPGLSLTRAEFDALAAEVRRSSPFAAGAAGCRPAGLRRGRGPAYGHRGGG